MDSCCEVYLDNVELEEKDIFGKEGNGFNRGVADFNFERWLVGCLRLRHGHLLLIEDALPSHANQLALPSARPIGRFQLNSAQDLPRWPSSSTP